MHLISDLVKEGDLWREWPYKRGTIVLAVGYKSCRDLFGYLIVSDIIIIFSRYTFLTN